MIREYVRDLVAGTDPGSPAPSERDLVDHFGVARMTVRQALDALVAEGVLERFPGRGTFVAAPRRRPTGISGQTEDITRRGLAPDARTLVAERIPADLTLARNLDIAEGNLVVRWRRVRLADNRPFCVSDAYLPDALVPGLLDRLPASLYEELTLRDVHPTWAEDSVSAGVATDEEAELLELPVGGVVLRHSRRGLREDRVVEISRTVFRGDQHILALQLRA